MKNEQEQLEALHDIRKMMKDSSKFLSLSGLSGVFAGVYALIGAWFGHTLISEYVATDRLDHSHYFSLLINIAIICAVVLITAITTAFLFSANKAKKTNQKLFDHTSKNLFWSMIVPLFAGGMFCLALLYNGALAFVSPVMLLFYSMALINCNRYTVSDIKYLGYFELLLGIAAAFFPGHGLLFWTLGFGVLHIIYGAIIWFKYDRKATNEQA